jgi:hypothetical protein
MICVNCKNEFKVKPYRSTTAKYCSNSCRVLHKQAKTLSQECLTCSRTFYLEQWKVRNSHKGLYCSSTCYRKRHPLIDIECICGKIFKVHRSRASYYNRLYCNQECYLKNGFFGRLSNDIPEISRYSKFVASLRSTASYLHWKTDCLKQDQSKCQICKALSMLTVHHIVSIYDFVKKHGLNKEKIEQDPLFFNTENGQTLCRACHLNMHRKEEQNE